MELKRACEAAWENVDVIITPTAGTIYRIAEVNADPVQLNSNLGYYTNFMNLLDLSAVAVPAGFRADDLPFGVTLFAPAFTDTSLLALADRLHRANVTQTGALQTALPAELFNNVSQHNEIAVAVCGAHMEGLALNHQLTERGARLIQRTHTAPHYNFYALPGGPPQRPGLVRVDNNGAAIEVEVWNVPAENFGSFVAGIPAPLGIGKIELAYGNKVSGFMCEAYAIKGAQDITGMGGVGGCFWVGNNFILALNDTISFRPDEAVEKSLTWLIVNRGRIFFQTYEFIKLCRFLQKINPSPFALLFTPGSYPIYHLPSK